MECLSLGGLIDAGVRVGCIRADIADMAKNMARCVLRPRRSEMRTDTAKDRGGHWLAVVLHRKAAYYLKADAVKQLFPELRKMGAKARQRKFFPGDLTDFTGGSKK